MAVVATRAGGIPDFVFDDDNGVLVPSGDEQAMAKALDRLITDGELRARLAERGRVTAQARGIETRADTLAEVYRAALRRLPQAPGGGR